MQPYTINSAKVIFLKPRPQSRPFKGSGNICLTCDRILQEPFHFCCLSCKVHYTALRYNSTTTQKHFCRQIFRMPLECLVDNYSKKLRTI